MRSININSEGRNTDRLVRHLYLRPKVWQEFRVSPEKVGARYGVSDDVVEAIKDGRQDILIAEGMDSRLIADPAYRFTDRAQLAMSRMVAVGLTVLLGLFFAVPGVRAQEPARRARAVRARGLVRARRRMGRAARRLARRARSRRAARRLGARRIRLSARYARLNDPGTEPVAKSTSSDDLPDDGSVTVLDPVE